MSDGLVNLILGIVVVGRNPQDRGQVTAFSVDTGAGSRRYPDNKACLGHLPGDFGWLFALHSETDDATLMLADVAQLNGCVLSEKCPTMIGQIRNPRFNCVDSDCVRIVNSRTEPGT